MVPQIELLNTSLINQHLKSLSLQHAIAIEVLPTVNSTNDYLLGKGAGYSGYHVVFAEQQTAGRGRMGSKWVSPYAVNLYASLACKFANNQPAEITPVAQPQLARRRVYSAFAGLSLVVGIAIIKVLNNLGLSGALIKWPNDIYYQHQKLAGILIETQSLPKPINHADNNFTQHAAKNEVLVVIGIGINVSEAAQIQPQINQACTDITSNVNKKISRNFLAALLLREVTMALEIFQRHGFSSFRNDWDRFDYLRGKQITISNNHAQITGQATGVSDDGALIVNQAGDLSYHYAGSIEKTAH